MAHELGDTYGGHRMEKGKRQRAVYYDTTHVLEVKKTKINILKRERQEKKIRFLVLSLHPIPPHPNAHLALGQGVAAWSKCKKTK